jgi:hypothetical protein
MDFSTASEIYKAFPQFPYACDIVSYFIFGYKESDNKIHNAIKGIYGPCACEASLSEYMLSYEFSFEENMETIDSDIREFILSDNRTMSEVY